MPRTAARTTPDDRAARFPASAIRPRGTGGRARDAAPAINKR
jgi:hypothetical protein